jgi:excisionase family DNA binding protein
MEHMDHSFKEVKAYNAADVAKVLRVSANMVRRYIYTGALPAARIGGRWRILHKDLVAFLDQAKAGEGKVRRRPKFSDNNDLLRAKKASMAPARDVFALKVTDARGTRAQVNDGTELIWVDIPALDYLVDRLDSLDTDEAVRAYERWCISARASLEG